MLDYCGGAFEVEGAALSGHSVRPRHGEFGVVHFFWVYIVPWVVAEVLVCVPGDRLVSSEVDVVDDRRDPCENARE